MNLAFCILFSENAPVNEENQENVEEVISLMPMIPTMVVRPLPRPSQAVPNQSNQPTRCRVSQDESDIHSEPRQVRPNLPHGEPLLNPFIDLQGIEAKYVLENNVLVQVHLQYEGGYTKVVNEGDPRFEFLRKDYNEA